MPPTHVRADDKCARTARHFAHQVIVEAQSPSPSNSPERSTAVAGWIVEKYRTWGDTGGNVESRFDKDFLLTTLTTYWLTQTIAPSVRIYYEMYRNRGSTSRAGVPVAFLMSRKDMFPPAPREWAERTHNVVHFSETPTGGHFLEWEEPQVVARDMQAFFAPLMEAGR